MVAVSADRTGIEGAKKFLDQIKVEKLGLYADPTVRITSTLKAIGMPATLLIDREGREIGRLVGPAEWDSPEAKAPDRGGVEAVDLSGGGRRISVIGATGVPRIEGW